MLDKWLSNDMQRMSMVLHVNKDIISFLFSTFVQQEYFTIKKKHVLLSDVLQGTSGTSADVPNVGL